MLVLCAHGDVPYPVRRADEALEARETPQLLAGEKPKGRAVLVRGGPRDRRGGRPRRSRPAGTAREVTGMAHPLCAHALCCIMGRVWAVNGGQQT